MNQPNSNNTPLSADQPTASTPDHLRNSDVILKSPGEYLLPFFLAAIESCWINGILLGLAGTGILGTQSSLLPFWGPPLVLLLSLWIFRHALQLESNAPASEETETQRRLLDLPGLRLMFFLVALIAVCMIWLHIYSPTYFLLDPGWLAQFASDLLSLNSHFFQAFLIVALSFYLCWRAMRIAQMHIETAHIFRQLWVGLLLLLLAILLRAGQSSKVAGGDDVVLLLLIPIFLYLTLSAHALARLGFIRREHPIGLDGSTLVQERSILGVITVVGIVLLILTLLGGSFLSPGVFESLQPIWQTLGSAYDWLARSLSQIFAIAVTPFFLLAQWLYEHFSIQMPTINRRPLPQQPPHRAGGIDPTGATVLLATKILIPIVILLVLTLLIYLALRKRRLIKISLKLTGGDIHESVWSWSLFWQQFRAFWRSLFQRFFPQKPGNEQAESQAEAITGPPAARTIRELYRMLLKKASTHGNTRKRDETPYEFQQRLDERKPELEPQLGQITEAYALTRYGGEVPNERELDIMRNLWKELDQKWKT